MTKKTKIKIVRYFDVPEHSRLHEVMILWLHLGMMVYEERNKVFILPVNQKKNIKRLKRIRDDVQEHCHFHIRRLDKPEDFSRWSFNAINAKDLTFYQIEFHSDEIKFRVSEIKE